MTIDGASAFPLLLYIIEVTAKPVGLALVSKGTRVRYMWCRLPGIHDPTTHTISGFGPPDWALACDRPIYWSAVS